MRRTIALLALLTVPVLAQSNPLRQAAADSVKSMAWKVRTEGVSMNGCGEGWTQYGDSAIEHEEIIVLVRLEAGRVTDLKLREPGCPVKADRLVSATADQSLDFLLDHLDDGERAGTMLAAISMHAHPRVVPELIRQARNAASSDVRRHAIFWLGHKAGEKAVGELRRAVDEDPNDEVRQHAVFAISQLPRERSVPLLIDLVKTHKRPAVRKRAMFWLAQSGDPRALALMEEILAR